MTDPTPGVLLVEADPEARYVLPRFLGPVRHVRVAQTLTEARALVAEECPELLILDPDLPDGDGLSLIPDTKEKIPWAQSLVLCGVDRSSETALFIAAGANDVIIKPFDIGTLEPRLARLVMAFEHSKKDFAQRQEMQVRLRHMDRVATLGTLLATVAHESANPLAAIMANCSYLRDTLSGAEPLTEKQRQGLQEATEEILLAARMFNAFITRIRGFSRRDDEALVCESLASVVDTALLFLRPKIAGKSVLISAPAPTEAPVVTHYSAKLIQAVANAVSNAVEAINGPGHVWIRYELTDNEVVIVIDDDGPGLAPEMRDKVLEPFYTTKPTGTGLGMSVIHQVMKKHRGRLELRTGPQGRGLSVRLVLPRG